MTTTSKPRRKPRNMKRPSTAPKRNPRRAHELPDNMTARAVAEAVATLSRPARTLPASWWDDGTAANMADWIRANVTRSIGQLAARFGGAR